jgi:hypothetical protein
MERLGEIEDDEIRSFLTEVLRHEREILEEPRGSYSEEYQEIVDKYVSNDTIGEYNDG